jgi:hypothetical protein
MALSKQLQRIHEAIMTIKQLGGVFGRNPTFNNVTIEGTLTFDGDIDINSDLTIEDNLYVLGSVGIGTSSPTQLLNLESATSPAILITDTTNTTSLLLRSQNNTSTVGTSSNHPLVFETNAIEAARIDSSQNLLVGGTSVGDSDSCAIESYGGITIARASGVGRVNMTFTNGGATVGTITTTASATAYNTSSDQRLKENIADADDAGAKIDAIQVRKFDWKADGSHQDYGVVAQELLEVAPEAISAPEDPEDMMGVDYSKLVPMLLKEIQSLRARIAALES